MDNKWFRLAVIAALLFWGCVKVEQYRAAQNYQEVIAVHTVQPGETMWTIAENYYCAEAECYNAFQYRVQADNAALTACGRELQPGDQLYIRYYVVKDEFN